MPGTLLSHFSFSAFFSFFIWVGIERRRGFGLAEDGVRMRLGDRLLLVLGLKDILGFWDRLGVTEFGVFGY